jgi:hypothetical protein
MKLVSYESTATVYMFETKMTAKKLPPLHIEPCTENSGTHFMDNIIGYTAEEINEKLGFKPNIEDDPFKVKYSWCFKVDGQLCAIWDWKMSYSFNQFSWFGPPAIKEQLFPNKQT